MIFRRKPSISQIIMDSNMKELLKYIERGGAINTKSYFDSPLYYAIWWHWREGVDLLRKHGAETPAEEYKRKHGATT